MLPLLLLGLTVVGCFVLLDRKDRRHAQQIADLCQRLQAPEQAVIEHAAQPFDGPLFVSPFDDDAFHDAKDAA